MKRIFILSLFILYVQSKDSIFQHSKDVVHSILHRDHFLKVEESKPIHYDFEKPQQMIRKYNYPIETHNVCTQDGYYLEMHRIIQNGTKNIKRKDENTVVFLQHGLFGSSADWILPGPKYGLAFLLSNLGYDVWMGNFRGTCFSKNHKTYQNKDSEYWNFSLEELGVYDLPAMIDYVLNLTSAKKMIFVGHSLGATAFYITCAEKPNYNSKISTMFSLAPLAFKYEDSIYFREFKTKLTKCDSQVRFLLDPFPKPSGSIPNLIDFLSEKDSIFFSVGLHSTNNNYTNLSTIAEASALSGTSIKVLSHILQIMESGIFKKYEKLRFQNWITLYPRNNAYKLFQVKTPVITFFSKNDWLSSPEMIDKLYLNLGINIGKYLVRDEKFKNSDFIWSLNVKEQVYNKLLRLMDVFSQMAISIDNK